MNEDTSKGLEFDKDSNIFGLFENYENELVSFLNNDVYSSYSSTGREGHRSCNPWVSVFNTNVTLFSKEGFYLCYVFELKDCPAKNNDSNEDAVVLTLMFGEEAYGGDKDLLLNNVEQLRDLIKKSNIVTDFSMKINQAGRYKDNIILAKRYYKKDLEEGNVNIEEDFSNLIGIYEYIVNKLKLNLSVDEWKNLIKNNQNIFNTNLIKILEEIDKERGETIHIVSKNLERDKNETCRFINDVGLELKKFIFPDIMFLKWDNEESGRMYFLKTERVKGGHIKFYLKESLRRALVELELIEDNGKIDVNMPFSNPQLDLNPKDLQENNKLILEDNLFNMVSTSLNAGKNIIFDGVPGTGKTDLAIQLAEFAKDNNYCNGYIVTTATSDWTTFDTIGGLTPTKSGELEFSQGKFLESIEKNKWLIIDEINRSDIDKSFGQFFTVLSGQSVELSFGKETIKIEYDKDSNRSYKEGNTYYIGNNWRILGTMNIKDKDYLYDLSYAFMRRFVFLRVNTLSCIDFKDLLNEKDLNENLVKDMLEIYESLEENKTQLGLAIYLDMINYIESCENRDISDKNLLAEAVNILMITINKQIKT